MARSSAPPRRRYPAELKARVLAACAQRGASIVRVARDHGLQAYIVYSWRRDAKATRQAPRAATAKPFIELPMINAGASSEIRIALTRADTSITVNWPMRDAAQCAAWLRELLQ